MATSVAYTALLTVREETVLFLSDLLNNERRRRGTRTGRRSLTCFKQAVLVLRWFLDGTRLAQLAADNTLGLSTAYRYLHEGIDVLNSRRPSLHSALLAAKMAGHTHINLDGTLIHTDRCATPGPTPGVDLWWSGKHHHHGAQHPGHLQPRRMATMDLAGTPRPRTRLHLPQGSPRHPASVGRVDR